MSAECGYQILVTKILYVMEAGYLTFLRNFMPNISALSSKHCTYYVINNGQTTELHCFKLAHFFWP